MAYGISIDPPFHIYGRNSPGRVSAGAVVGFEDDSLGSGWYALMIIGGDRDDRQYKQLAADPVRNAWCSGAGS